MQHRTLYHCSQSQVSSPEVRVTRYNKDFYHGFYCTENRGPAERWATRFSSTGVLNKYRFIPNDRLSILRFDHMTEEWLDFIADCRSEKPHGYDIVEGLMADDQIFNYVQNFYAPERMTTWPPANTRCRITGR